MRPFFTIHAGEFLVASYIEDKFKNLNIWIPAKDSGIDLLLTNSTNTKSVSIQVKFSRDFLTTHMDDIFQKGLLACGWWSLNMEKIEKSKADFWVFALHKFNAKELQFIIITPSELLQLHHDLNRSDGTIQSYIWITRDNKCWEARGLKKQEQILLTNNSFNCPTRNLTCYLNNWDRITNTMK